MKTLTETQCGTGNDCTCELTTPENCPEHMPQTTPKEESGPLLYTVGFAFDAECNRVTLIHKDRSWQRGMLNGVGGHQEIGETPAECQSREFFEEAGVLFVPESWTPFATLAGGAYRVECFTLRTTRLNECITKTDEVIENIWVHDLAKKRTVPNLRFLVPMAIDFFRCKKHSVITEPSS